MMKPTFRTVSSAIFITFSGNCQQALSFYRACFGGELLLETFKGELVGYHTSPVVSGSLVSDRIAIYGSDLGHNEGRKIGNCVAVYLNCKDANERKTLIKKLNANNRRALQADQQKLIEITDAFDVNWILSI